MAGKYRDALSTGEKIIPISGAILGFLISAECNFYYSLSIIAIYNNLPPKERKHYWKRLKKNQKQMKKWSESCKMNFEHKYLLVEAEIARITSMKDKAMILYDQAIKSARSNNYVQNEALANELAAKFYLSHNHKKIAKAYMSDAFRLYNSWGAYVKAKELVNLYPELLDGIGFNIRGNRDSEILKNISITTQSDSDEESNLDIYFIEKAMDNISKETDINKLLESFLNIATQSMGADRGYIILEKSDELFIEAMRDSNIDGTLVKTLKTEDCDNLSKAVVRYVARTSETVVLNTREYGGIFAGDPYIAESSPKSIACIPLLFQGISLGVLYFENSYIPAAFSNDQLETLKLLSTQIAYIKKFQEYLEKDSEKVENVSQSNLIEPLTERETEVLNLIAKGLSNKEIADRLELTINTVKGYIKNIYEKLEVNRRVQVVIKAKKLNLLKDL